MTSTPSFFCQTSSFVMYATLATRSIFIQLLRLTVLDCRTTMSEAIRIYFDGTNLTEKTISFKLLLNQYLRTCCDEYLSIHQQIVTYQLEESDLNEDNIDHYVYCTMEKILSENNGYKHLNCIFDGVMKFCWFQFELVFAIISYEGVLIDISTNNCDGNLAVTELNILEHILQKQLNRINARSQTLYVNNDQYKPDRLKCEENDSCKLLIENEKQRLEQQDKLIRQTIYDNH